MPKLTLERCEGRTVLTLVFKMTSDLCEVWSRKLPTAYTSPSNIKGPCFVRRGLPCRRPFSPIGEFCCWILLIGMAEITWVIQHNYTPPISITLRYP
jgi:hypothetical protein